MSGSGEDERAQASDVKVSKKDQRRWAELNWNDQMGGLQSAVGVCFWNAFRPNWLPARPMKEKKRSSLSKK